MKNKESKKRSFKKFYSSGDVIAKVLAGSADYHYGFYYTVHDPNKLKEYARRLKEGKLRYETTKKERVKLAKVPFVEFGSTFNSYEEVQEVAKLIEERHGKENPGRVAAEKLIAGLLSEVRTR